MERRKAKKQRDGSVDPLFIFLYFRFLLCASCAGKYLSVEALLLFFCRRLYRSFLAAFFAVFGIIYHIHARIIIRGYTFFFLFFDHDIDWFTLGHPAFRSAREERER